LRDYLTTRGLRSLKPLIIARQFLPPIGGTDERVWNVALELSKIGLDVTLCMRLGKQVEKNRGPHIIEMPPRPQSAKMPLWLIQLIAHSRFFDVIQIESFDMLKSAVFCIIFKPLIRNCVLVLHDKHWPCDPRKIGLKAKLEYLVQRIVLNLYDKIIVPGDELKRWFLNLHGAKFNDKFLVIPNGAPTLDLRRYDSDMARKKYGLPSDAFIAVFFGSMLFRPNQETVRYIYDISERIAKRFEKLTKRALLFVITGKGTERFQNSPFITTLGFVDDLFEVLTAADVCFIPHEPSYSGPHVKTLYSFAAKKAVITTKDGIKDMIGVKDGTHILLFDMDNPDSIVDALVKLAADQDLREKICNNAYFYAKSHSWRDVAIMYRNVYKNLVNSNKGVFESDTNTTGVV